MNRKRLVWIAIAIVIVVIIGSAGAFWYFSGNAPAATPSSSSTISPSASNSPSPHTTESSTGPTANPPTPVQTPVTTPTNNVPTATPALTPTSAQVTSTFDFDSGTPTLSPLTPTPFDQTSNGVTAHFSSPTDSPSHPSFSVQNLGTLASISVVMNSSKFSGLFLWPSTVSRDRLDISFSRSITSITFSFKTAELHDPGPGGTGSPIELKAYVDSASSPVEGSVIVYGKETPFDTYPEGTLTFTSNSPFNFVEINLPFIAEGATGFIADNIIVVTA